MINKEYFRLKDAVEQYGVKNLRFLMMEAPNDFTFFKMTGMPISLSSCEEDRLMPAIYKIQDFHPHHKTRLVPLEIYNIPVSHLGQEAGMVNMFPNKYVYTNDIEVRIRDGYAKVFVETEDGYDLVFGVYANVFNNDDISAMEWAKNVFNNPTGQQL